jgi:EmrB/QacA subfamily drug resistance transporter
MDAVLLVGRVGYGAPRGAATDARLVRDVRHTYTMPDHPAGPISASVSEPLALPKTALYVTVAGLMLALLLSALDQTIVGTAMPRVASELHGFEHYAWVTTVYLLTSTSVVPIVGKLSDLYGRRWFLLCGVASFLLTSALCGLSQDMTQLIVFRGMQGVAGGVLMATVFTVISTLFPPAERARMQGLFSAVFGLASIVGPLLGGYLTDSLSWRWVFYVNLPVGIVALVVLWTFYRDAGPRRPVHSVDYVGALSLTAAVVPLLLVLSWGGQQFPWTSPPIVAMSLLATVMLAAFLWTEAHTAEPILPLSLFRNNVLALSALSIGILGVAMFGTILYIPLFVQGVIGTSATQSGTVLTPMMFAMIASSILGGQAIARTGRYKLMAIGGLSVAAGGLFLLSGMGPDTDYATAVRNMVLVGLGLGPVMPVFTLASQSAARVDQIGVATSLTQFARSIGGTLGTAIFGSLLLNQLGAARPSQVGAGATPDRLALAAALDVVFLVGACVVLAGVLVVVFLKEIPLRGSQTVPAPGVATLPPLRPKDEPLSRRAS